MDKKERKLPQIDAVVAPSVDEEDEFGEDATKSDIEKGNSTKVTRFTYDEYDPSQG